MLRTSDFVRKDDVLDPDRDPVPTGEVDYDGAGSSMRSSVVAMVCVLGMVALAVLQPHARNYSPAGSHAAAPAAVIYPH